MVRGSTGGRVSPYGWATVCALLTYLVRLALDPLIGARTPFVVLFFLPVIIGAWRGGVGPALLAAVLGIALGDRVTMDFDNGIPLIARVVRVSVFLFESWFVGWLFDSRRKEALARLEAESRYRVFLENYPGGIVAVVDRGMRFQLVSGLGLGEIGRRASDFVGLSPTDPGSHELASRLAPIFESALEGKYEVVEVDVDERTFLVRSAPILRDGVLVGALAVAQNISDRRRLEAELRETQKLEAVGKLAGGVAHDFNNVLGVVTASVDSLRAARLAPAHQRFVDAIDDAVERARDLTRQLLEFSRRQVLETQRLDLNALVKGDAAHFRSIAGGEIGIAFELDENLGLVEANRIEVERTLANLVTNARDAIDGPGTITIRTRMRPSRQEVASEQTWALGAVELEVADDGTGMDDATRENLGRKYFTTKSVGRGSGLGLSIVHAFVARSRGRLEIDSKPGEGSTFRVVLPAVLGELEAPGVRRMRPVPPTTRAHGAKVLVVDDEDSIRSFTAQFLAGRGFEVEEAPDADSALAKMTDDVDIVVTDLGLPGMNGVELCRVLHARYPNVRLVLVSGSSEVDAQTDALVDLGARFLPKPFHLRDLLAIVESLASGTESAEITGIHPNGARFAR